MGKRKNKVGRCVKRNKNVLTEPEEFVQAPHSFVIHKGLPGGHILELTKDFRKVMEPFTATSLKERKKNTIKDFVSVAGMLHVTHMCIFSNTDIGMYLKIARFPRGPTLTFKICNFSLSRDVVSSLKKQNVVEQAFKHSPLIVMNSFSGEGVQMKLMASMFQNMFPTINLTKVDLNTVRRCVLLNYNPTTKQIDFRHYNIKLTPVGVSKGVKKVVTGKIPNLAKCDDIEDFLTKGGIVSESEFEDDPNLHVTLNQKIIARGNVEEGKSAIRLTELGPRLTLQLIKIEDALFDGEVLYHDLISKTEDEKEEIRKKREARKKLKAKRKRIQEDNKKKKEQAKLDNKEKSLKGMQKNQEKTENEAEKNDEDDDAEYYRQEVGEEPDKDMFKTGVKRPFQKTFNKKDKAKKVKFNDKEDKKEFNPNIKGRAFKVKRKLVQRKGTKNLMNRDKRPVGILKNRK
ncbi:protein Peter pan [Onthophagus taurus]|uniref:protein Peter pan n=1 Tax=Onthophagus taurus TaxID=166361 RepID=UPI0039BE6A0D